MPAVSELFLLVGEGEVFALVLLGLDAADLIDGGRVVEQQDDQAADRREALEAVAAGELVAGFGGEQPSLAGVEYDERPGWVGAVADAGHELAGAAEHAGEALDAVAGDLAALVGCELEVLERDALERALGSRGGDGGDIEQRGLGSSGGDGVGHAGLVGVWLGLTGRVGGGLQRGDGSPAIWSSASAGSVMTVMRSASTESGAMPMLRWMTATPWACSR